MRRKEAASLTNIVHYIVLYSQFSQCSNVLAIYASVFVYIFSALRAASNPIADLAVANVAGTG